MVDHDDFFDSLPFNKDDAHPPTQDNTVEEALEAVQVEGGDETEPDPRLGTDRKEVVRKPKKKKKKVLKRKKILKKKKPEEPPVEEVEEEIDEQEDEYDEGAEAEEPENFLDDEAEDKADESTDAEEEPDIDEEDSPLATLPFAKSTSPADSPSLESPPKTQAAALPVEGEKRKVRMVKKKKKKKKTSTSHAEPVDRSEINKLWDKFLRSLTQATLVAVYEMGISSILDFEKYSLGQLSKPRGHLTVAQAKEVETWLNKHNVKLNQSSVDSPLANIRGAGARVTRGLRIPIKNITVPDDASARDKRRARFTNTRATM